MVILGLDIGEKRVGVAKSDELGMFSHPIGFIDREPEDVFLAKLDELITEYTVDKIVVGLPINMDGSQGIACENMMIVVEKLKAHCTIPIETWDERLTTKEAMRYMAGGSISGKKKRKKVDALAAQIMLQNYLDCAPK